MQASDGMLREREVEGAVVHMSLGVRAAAVVSHTDLSLGGFLGEGKGHMDWLVGWAKLFHSPSPFSPFCFCLCFPLSFPSPCYSFTIPKAW